MTVFGWIAGYETFKRMVWIIWNLAYIYAEILVTLSNITQFNNKLIESFIGHLIKCQTNISSKVSINLLIVKPSSLTIAVEISVLWWMIRHFKSLLALCISGTEIQEKLKRPINKIFFGKYNPKNQLALRPIGIPSDHQSIT